PPATGRSHRSCQSTRAFRCPNITRLFYSEQIIDSRPDRRKCNETGGGIFLVKRNDAPRASVIRKCQVVAHVLNEITQEISNAHRFRRRTASAVSYQRLS